MPRRAARLTLAKKKPYKKRKLAGGDPATPTDDEWKGMIEFGSFIVRDEEGDEHTFRRGDTAIVLPHGVKVGQAIELCDYWVVKIREVRLRTPEDVWTRVQWYWSGDEVHGAIKSFDSKACGRYERIFSDHFDYVSTSAFDAAVPMKKLNDTDIEQPYIPRDVFYTRYTFEYRARVIQPKPSSECLCALPYSPDSPSPSSLMHFCPRPACRRWYHAACLVGAGYRDGDGDKDGGKAARGRRLLGMSPDVDGVGGLEEMGGGEGGRGRGRGKGRVRGEPVRKKVRVASGGSVGKGRGRGRGRAVVVPSTRTSSRGKKFEDSYSDSEDPDQNADSDTDPSSTLLASLPPDLVLIASQPIVRGAAFPAGGVSGNVGGVVRARRMVYKAVGGGEEVPEDWEGVLGVGVGEAVVELEGASEEDDEDDEDSGDGKVKTKTKGRGKGKGKKRVKPRESVAALLCPECGGAI
ncbi:hypothetical protein FPV67DRAFT_1702791 [Lyophyllum atratum]|nr:hypothetical protein FPV67DRAFT_1702791 [Lyophyllum atratum]